MRLFGLTPSTATPQHVVTAPHTGRRPGPKQHMEKGFRGRWAAATPLPGAMNCLSSYVPFTLRTAQLHAQTVPASDSSVHTNTHPHMHTQIDKLTPGCRHRTHTLTLPQPPSLRTATQRTRHNDKMKANASGGGVMLPFTLIQARPAL